jgi:putative addiction module killer protein
LEGEVWAVLTTEEFDDWIGAQAETVQARVRVRFKRLARGHLGRWRPLGGGLFELKWENGLRAYYFSRRAAVLEIVVLWAGFKASQPRDIEYARRLKGIYGR